MKILLRYSFVLIAVCAIQGRGFAQWINCSETSVPGQFPLSEAPFQIEEGTLTPQVDYSIEPQGGTETPLHEFAVTLSGHMAFDNLGPKLLGAVPTTVFDPASLGIEVGQTFCLTPVSLNLNQIRNLVDSILTNSTTCCPLLNLLLSPGFCDTLTDMGYTSANDVNGLNDVYRVFRAMDTLESMSLEGFVFRIAQVNNAGVSAGAFFPASCGSQSFPVCYAVHHPFAQTCFEVVAGPGESVAELSAASLRAFRRDGMVQIEADRLMPGSYRLRITDPIGRLLQQEAFSPDGRALRLSYPALGDGMLLVQVSGPSGTLAAKVPVR